MLTTASNRCPILRKTKTTWPEDNDKDSTHSGVAAGDGDEDGEGEVVVDVVADVDGNGNGNVREDEEEDSSDDFFDAGEGTVIHDRLSLGAVSESGQSGSGGGAEDNPFGPVTPSAGCPTILHHGKATAVDFSRTISSDLTDLVDEEWGRPNPHTIYAARTRTNCIPTPNHREDQVVWQR
jgi:hypothetical protein